MKLNKDLCFMYREICFQFGSVVGAGLSNKEAVMDTAKKWSEGRTCGVFDDVYVCFAHGFNKSDEFERFLIPFYCYGATVDCEPGQEIEEIWFSELDKWIDNLDSNTFDSLGRYWKAHAKAVANTIDTSGYNMNSESDINDMICNTWSFEPNNVPCSIFEEEMHKRFDRRY